MYRFDGVVVITSALHAEGREFDPRSKYFFKSHLLIESLRYIYMYFDTWPFAEEMFL